MSTIEVISCVLFRGSETDHYIGDGGKITSEVVTVTVFGLLER